MLRSFVLADLFTFANAACGMASILSSIRFAQNGSRADAWLGFAVLPVALVCDGLDGAVARWRRKQSPLGADLDSLADVVSFGVAPAVLGYTLGLNGAWDVVVLVVFVVCGISRLARYNATAADMADDAGKVTHYQGTPIPTSCLIVVMLTVAFARGAVGPQIWWGAVELGPWTLHPLVVIYLVSGSLMVSTLKIPKI